MKVLGYVVKRRNFETAPAKGFVVRTAIETSVRSNEHDEKVACSVPSCANMVLRRLAKA